MKIQIKVNKQTSPIIQKILFERGYKWFQLWGGSEREALIPKFTDLPFLYVKSREIFYGGEEFRDRDAIQIDASTQLGELLDLLDAKEITVKDVAIASELGLYFTSRDGIISADKTYLTVGCSRVSKEKVKEVYEKMFS